MKFVYRKNKAPLQMRLYCHMNGIRPGQKFDAEDYLLFSRRMLKKYGYPTDKMIPPEEFYSIDDQLKKDYPFLREGREIENDE